MEYEQAIKEITEIMKQVEEAQITDSRAVTKINDILAGLN